MEPATFEHPKVGICIPTTGLLRAAMGFSTFTLIGNFGKQEFWESFWPESKSRAMTVFMREGSGVGPNRQRMVMEALASDPPCTHILFIDEDMEFEARTFASLARRRLPIVGVNYRMRFPPANFTAVHLDRSRGRMDTTEKSLALEPVDYMGFGLCLIETRVFRALDRPWFLQQYIEDEYTTEDLPFFYAARKAGFTAFCDQEASKDIYHLGLEKYHWSKQYADPAVEAKDKSVPTLSAVPSSPVSAVGAG